MKNDPAYNIRQYKFSYLISCCLVIFQQQKCIQKLYTPLIISVFTLVKEFNEVDHYIKSYGLVNS
jgi:hypothetical protein